MQQLNMIIIIGNYEFGYQRVFYQALYCTFN